MTSPFDDWFRLFFMIIEAIIGIGISATFLAIMVVVIINFLDKPR